MEFTGKRLWAGSHEFSDAEFEVVRVPIAPNDGTPTDVATMRPRFDLAARSAFRV